MQPARSCPPETRPPANIEDPLRRRGRYFAAAAVAFARSTALLRQLAVADLARHLEDNARDLPLAAAFERADAIVALEGLEPDAGDRAIQRSVIAGELTSGQAVQLIIEQALAAIEPWQQPGPFDPKRSRTTLATIVVTMDHVKT